MHLFLTGEIQVGKSTLLRSVLSRLALGVGGFCTLWRGTGEGATLHLLPWGADLSVCTAENQVGVRRELGRAGALPGAFDRLGPALLSPLRGDVTVMDELGFLERDAPAFQSAVLRRLEAPTPVFGVVKPRGDPFLDKVRAQPGVELVWVTPDNRQALADTLTRRLENTWKGAGR